MPDSLKKFIIIVLLLWTASPVSALEIKDYPAIPGLVAPSENCTGSDCLPIYISYWVGLLIYAAGALAAMSLAVGGIQLIMSGENPENAGNAKDRVKGAILGLILTMSSFIILKTINPALITPILTPLPGVAGVFYTNNIEEKSAREAEPNTANIPEGFNTIFYKCSNQPDGAGTGPFLLIWKFPKINFQGNDENYNGVKVVKKTCGEKEPLSGSGSFKIAFETPGVYYFLEENCQGLMSGTNLSNQQKISEPFNDKIKSIRIVNSADSNSFFGFVAHEAPGFEGKCGSLRYLDRDGYVCLNVGIEVSSINIFQWNGFGENWKTSGSGVKFFGNPFGKTGLRAGAFVLTKEKINKFWTEDPKNMIFNYEGINIPEEEKAPCKNFGKEDCPGYPGSIQVLGDYLVVLYSGLSTNPCPVGQCLNTRNICVDEPNDFCLPRRYGAQHCYVFYKDAPNLKDTGVGAEGKKIFSVDVLPIK
ncbi:MAG: hypothetical protein CEN87_24 [Parcubacteria group bacterium Licking1014_1]|nr:MAG: hypothetical protein CEN87_24 [Parcubacteria group bacterium Licking1014_1]